MSDILPFLLMTEAEAARLREATLDDQEGLEPRLVAAGDHAGSYVLPRRVLFDEAFAAHRDAFGLMEEVVLDVAAAWPVVGFPPAGAASNIGAAG